MAVAVRRVLPVVALALAGCAAPPSQTVRDVSAPISSQADITPARLVGTWAVRVAWPGNPALVPPGAAGASRATEMRFAMQGQGLALAGTGLVADGETTGPVAFATAIEPTGPGRFRETGGDVLGGGEMWVLWMDADDRTAAIGTPDGGFGWIMDRKPTGGGDRIRAAREIMEWRGYDMALARE